MLQNVPDYPGRHMDYPDELRITHSLHSDDAGLTPNCNASRTAPDVLYILKHPGSKTSGVDSGPPRNDQPMITPDRQGPAKDESRICHESTRTTPDSWSGVARDLIGLTGALHLILLPASKGTSNIIMGGGGGRVRSQRHCHP